MSTGKATAGPSAPPQAFADNRGAEYGERRVSNHRRRLAELVTGLRQALSVARIARVVRAIRLQLSRLTAGRPIGIRRLTLIGISRAGTLGVGTRIGLRVRLGLLDRLIGVHERREPILSDAPDVDVGDHMRGVRVCDNTTASLPVATLSDARA